MLAPLRIERTQLNGRRFALERIRDQLPLGGTQRRMRRLNHLP
jgi:hypothetical protein